MITNKERASILHTIEGLLGEHDAHVGGHRVEAAAADDVDVLVGRLFAIAQLHALQELGLAADVDVMSARGQALLDHLLAKESKLQRYNFAKMYYLFVFIDVKPCM